MERTCQAHSPALRVRYCADAETPPGEEYDEGMISQKAWQLHRIEFAENKVRKEHKQQELIDAAAARKKRVRQMRIDAKRK